MKKKLPFIDAAVYAVLIICMVFICSISSVQFWYDGTINNYLLFAVIFLTTVFCFAVHYTKYALFALVLPFLLPRPLYILSMVKGIISGLPDFIQDIYNNGYISSQYSTFITDIAVICVVFLVLACYYIGVVKKRSMVLIITGAAMYTTYFYYSEKKMELSCSFFMVCGIMLYAFNNYIRKKKYVSQDKGVKSGKYALGWLPSVLIIMIISMFLSPFMPNPVRSKSISRLEKFIIKLTEGIDGPGIGTGKGTGVFSISSTGFQESSGRLGGPVRLNDSVAFIVKSDDRINGMHMRGVIKDHYTGDVWNSNDINDRYDADKPLGFDPLMSTSSTQKNVTITYKVKGIRTIFNALYPVSISTRQDTLYGDNNMQLLSSKDIEKDESYSVAIKEYSWTRNSLINASVKDENQESKQYLSLPSNISQRVYQLADTITNGYDMPYLKASAIEKYLKNNFPYSLDTSELPENAEFVDYFLFEEKKGSCTYYATAMAVMCRIEGIPSRYVEGFVVPAGSTKEGLNVRNSDAHAWVELYFDDLGWIVFDPTPGHASGALDPDSPNGQEEEPTPEITPEEGGETTPQPTKPQGENQTPGDTPIGQDENGSNRVPLILWAAIGLLSLVIFLSMFMIVYYSNASRRLYYEFFKLTRYGKALGIAYKPGQSVREYI